jgi:TRAP-type C4-dicarboxylate transport system permease large subunit
MIIGTIPIVFPLVVALGIDPVWFGIFLVVMAELALITPPVGMNLYVVQGIRKEGLITDVIVGTLPFLLMMLLLVVLRSEALQPGSDATRELERSSALPRL